jgi:hypothetical protein
LRSTTATPARSSGSSQGTDLSRSIGPRLPPEIERLLDGTDLDARVGATFTLVTTGPDGWPSFALLSAGEVLATADDTVRVALWPTSTSTANLGATGRGTLVVIDRGVSYLRLEARRGPDLAFGGGALAYFECRVADVLEDIVTYATITSGITFELPDSGPVVARWRATIEGLRTARPLASEPSES